ncbi:MAG TPA: aquaporin [Candidatus Acidoferrum sp.]|nr:aquaporin [Candidatus Acidoferrum sp.]
MNLQRTSEELKHELNFVTSLQLHWPEYTMELTEMGLYLFTCIFATLFQHPASPIRHLLPNSIVRRAALGISVGATIVAIVLTPWGKQSGGHLNPAMTFTFYRLGRVEFWDAIFYGVAQFAGATAGVAIASALLLGAPGNPTIRYAATLPGLYGAGVAFIAEVAISCALMLTVLFASNHTVLCRYTPYCVGALYAIFFLWVRDGNGSYCAKLHHASDKRCIFCRGTQHVAP